MDQERTRIARPRTEDSGQPFAERESTLLAASRGWTGAARAAHAEVEKGAEVIKHVTLRHNTSGQ